MATRIYIASDFHAAEKAWRKFLNAARFYQADTLILGGDVSGKAVVPVVARPGDGFLIRQFHGERVLTADETAQVETRIRDMGFYPYRTTDEELEEIWDDPEAVHAVFLKDFGDFRGNPAFVLVFCGQRLDAVAAGRVALQHAAFLHPHQQRLGPFRIFIEF